MSYLKRIFDPGIDYGRIKNIIYWAIKKFIQKTLLQKSLRTLIYSI